MSEHMFGASDAADSAGQPWAGRSFEPNPHATDDGSAPEHLSRAVQSFLSGEGSIQQVVDAVRTARLLIPLVAEAGDVGITSSGLAVDKTQELSIVTVATPDERTALPVFSSVAAMSAWNPEARPVPSDGIRAALAAAGEGTPVIVLDPGTAETVALRRPAVWAIAQGISWVPVHQDARVLGVLNGSSDDALRGINVRNGDPLARLTGPDLDVELQLDPGLTQSELTALLERLTSEWYADGYFAEHVDRLGVRVVPAND
ncbi:MAG: SseB family protein [Agromyces sp.]